MALPFLPIFDVRAKVYKKRVLLEHLTRTEIRKHCGVSEMYVDQLFDLLEPLVEHSTNRNHSVPAETQVLTALSFFRSGSFQYVESSVTGMSQSTTSRVISAITDAIISELMPQFVHFPSEIHLLNFAKSKFFDIAGFPNVVGLIDGTHINIKAPHENEHVFVNRKNTHSINCQVVCDYDNSFKDIVAKYPGCTHDAYIWRNCTLKQRFISGEFGNSWLLGDSGYGVEPSLLTPFSPSQNDQEEKYNRSHKRTRSLVERSIGVWKARWRCVDLSGGRLCYDASKVCKMIIASAVLHNFCVKRRIPLLDEDEDQVEERLRRQLHDDGMDVVNTQTGIAVRNNVVVTHFS